MKHLMKGFAIMYSSDLFQYNKKGTGVIIICRNRFLFAISNQEFWIKSRLNWEVTFTNTGGKVEVNETIIEATKREVMEELGCNVQLLSSNLTMYSNLDQMNLVNYKVADNLAPILVYNSDRRKISVSVFIGKINMEPHPKNEVPALLLLPPSFLNGGRLNVLIRRGAILKEQVEVKIPRNTILRPFGSAKILAHYLGRFLALETIRNIKYLDRSRIYHP
jgi:8-oxo-dGTP pyrophosphatase MutT (NUDIX family)